MSIKAAAILTLFAPLLGCVLIALLGNRLPQKYAGWLATGAGAASFIGALAAFFALPEGGAGQLVSLYSWLDTTWLTGGAATANPRGASELLVQFSLYIDALSVLEMLVVSGVGTLIVLYSVGYMKGDPQERRFMAYMNLFLFAMLMLVMAGNLVFLLIGWGLVGMASYLLIGFWHHRPTATAAAKKAFIINAIGDIGIALALFMIFLRTGSLDYPDVFEHLPETVGHDTTTALVIGLLLLLGALAKSAQLPLHTWLPDAMEGPTPVSALIHAATMVTAGVYLVARFGEVFALSHFGHELIAIIGAVTLVFAGIVALAQTDIKRVIAYSTMSQIGYMFVGVGIGAYGAGMFHLMTHAFFKALLFLAAGVIIHALADQQDIRLMGGLKERMPSTYKLFAVASLALAGIIPLSGFFSKDEILFSAFEAGTSTGKVVWALGLVGVFLTGMYSMRLLFLVFHGKEGKASTSYDAHGHKEGPPVMMWPLWVLGVLSVVGGWIAIPGMTNHLSEFLGHSVAVHGGEHDAGKAWLMALVSLAVALAGIFVARNIWLTGSWAAWRERWPNLRSGAEAAFGWDALFDRIVYRPAAGLANFIRWGVEDLVIDNSMVIVGRIVRAGGTAMGALQAGLVRGYAVGMTLGIVGIVIWLALAQG